MILIGKRRQFTNIAGSRRLPQVALLQKALNEDDFLFGGMVPDVPLKEDGIAGPKTRRVLRRTVSRFGADGVIGQLL